MTEQVALFEAGWTDQIYLGRDGYGARVSITTQNYGTEKDGLPDSVEKLFASPRLVLSSSEGVEGVAVVRSVFERRSLNTSPARPHQAPEARAYSLYDMVSSLEDLLY